MMSLPKAPRQWLSTKLVLIAITQPIRAQHYTNSYPPRAQHILHPLPHEYLVPDDLPQSFSWQNVNGNSYLTRVRNQHIPQYCGSCWAHSAMSALSDRVKIMRSYVGPQQSCDGGDHSQRQKTNTVGEERLLSTTLGQLGPPPGPDIDLSVQYLLNCGISSTDTSHPHHLSCLGGNSLYAYEYIHSTLHFIPEDSCLGYISCSEDSNEGMCPLVRSLTTCEAWNVCRTCDPPSWRNETTSRTEDEARDNYGCRAIPHGAIPNVTILEFGSIEPGNIHAIKSEIFARGPIKASINANFLLNYTSGILGSDDDPNLLNTDHNHGVSIVGWGYDEDRMSQHWIIRNSWGIYWGEMGFFRIELGRNLLGIEDNLAWATPAQWTSLTSNCRNSYIDPSIDVAALLRR